MDEVNNQMMTSDGDNNRDGNDNSNDDNNDEELPPLLEDHEEYECDTDSNVGSDGEEEDEELKVDKNVNLLHLVFFWKQTLLMICCRTSHTAQSAINL